MPRRNDALIIDLILDSNRTSDAKRGLNRCRLASQAIFVSDVTTANGRKIERSLLNPVTTEIDRSSYTFPREHPSASDWTEWAIFWAQFAGPDLLLHQPLGEWLHPTHRKWNWFYNEEEDRLYKKEDQGSTSYIKATNIATRTRLGQYYQQLDPATRFAQQLACQSPSFPLRVASCSSKSRGLL